MSPRIRALSRAVVLAVIAVLLAGVTAAVTSPAGALAPASASHPFSDPAYWPLRVESKVDCYRSNPGCRSPHSNWLFDVVPTGQGYGQPTSHAGVYSMGAGIVHYGNAHGPRCGTPKKTSYGTYVWVDHGAGIVSRYGHLSKITVRNGQQVAAGQQLGVVGTSGKKGNCNVAYLDFSVARNGLQMSHGYDMGSLIACSAATGTAQRWPAAFSGHASWNSLHQSSVIPASSGACLPSAAPRTSTRPARVTVSSGSGKLRVRWTSAAASAHVNAVMVEVSEFHTSRNYWDLPRNQRWVRVSPSHTSALVSALTKHRLHRVRVSFHNAAGWSAPTPWIQKKTK